MKTIVVPTDFSEISLNAVNYAANMAHVLNNNLSLIHVCPLPVAISEVPVPAYNIEDLVEDAEGKMNDLLDSLKNITGESIQISTIVREGDAITEINEYCRLVDPYAVVMGAESAGAFERFLMGGGKTISALNRLSWPIIVVPPGAKFVAIRKIGLACDFRKVVETIPVQEIKRLVNEFHAELHILHVNTHTEDPLGPEPVEESGWLEEILGDLNPKYHFIEGTDIENSLTEFAEKNNFDLLIIVPKNHNLISKIFKGSHSKRLVLHTHVPLMAIHE